MNEIEINTNKNQLDIYFINEFISNSYWAKSRTIETMQTCIDNSLNFGVYLQDRQIGFARVVSDFAQFAYIMDLFIQENYRGKGYSKKLMTYIMECDKLKNVTVWRLATTDAHGLYKQFGFDAIAKPEKLMELIR
ncbi:MAG: GNAT family N-acetyltransferase [Bacteroidetes bacterium]|nr:GNAT family N-acetyltransferase [Bacteroidota bacterium]